MKTKVSTLLASLTVVFFISISVKAQDAMPVLEPQDPIHRELNLDEDKTLIYDHPSHTSTTVRDSVVQAPVRIVPTTPAARNQKSDNHKNSRSEKEEDALSFNFLYYMLQKFKMSDWIDQN